MRVSKDPEVRRQEILDTAVALFCEKGYEHTSMQDISRKVQVSQGLCYRYFKSKEEIFETALEQYVMDGIERFRESFCDETRTLRDRIETLRPIVWQKQEQNPFHEFYHKAENSMFHQQMQLTLCDRLALVVTEQLELAMQKGEIHLENPAAAASFCLFGQLGVWMNPQLSEGEKLDQTKKLIKSVLGMDRPWVSGMDLL